MRKRVKQPKKRRQYEAFMDKGTCPLCQWQSKRVTVDWNSNKVIGEGEVEGKRSLIRLKLHQSDEEYYYPNELFPLSSRRGKRVYFHAQPYILIP
jgi:hypothetical protein